MDNRELAAVIRRCRNQIARPLGVNAAEVKEATERGYLVFVEWPRGHFEITDRGRRFLQSADE